MVQSIESCMMFEQILKRYFDLCRRCHYWSPLCAYKTNECLLEVEVYLAVAGFLIELVGFHGICGSSKNTKLDSILAEEGCIGFQSSSISDASSHVVSLQAQDRGYACLVQLGATAIDVCFDSSEAVSIVNFVSIAEDFLQIIAESIDVDLVVPQKCFLVLGDAVVLRGLALAHDPTESHTLLDGSRKSSADRVHIGRICQTHDIDNSRSYSWSVWVKIICTKENCETSILAKGPATIAEKKGIGGDRGSITGSDAGVGHWSVHEFVRTSSQYVYIVLYTNSIYVICTVWVYKVSVSCI